MKVKDLLISVAFLFSILATSIAFFLIREEVRKPVIIKEVVVVVTPIVTPTIEITASPTASLKPTVLKKQIKSTESAR